MRNLKLALLAASALALGGCAVASTPVSGFLYTGVAGPIGVTEATEASKMGKATCTSILGLIATGNCSTAQAKRNGGISEVSSVDHQTTNVLGLFATFTTVVHGK